MKYVVYEVWTTARVIEAENMEEAFVKGEPVPMPWSKLNLCNWHVVPVEDKE